MRTIEVQRPATAAFLLWRTLRYDLSRSRDMARYVARTRYALGGYTLYAVTTDGACLCFECCRTEYAYIARSDGRDGWTVAAIGNGADLEEPAYCDHCNAKIFDYEENPK